MADYEAILLKGRTSSPVSQPNRAWKSWDWVGRWMDQQVEKNVETNPGNLNFIERESRSISEPRR